MSEVSVVQRGQVNQPSVSWARIGAAAALATVIAFFAARRIAKLEVSASLLASGTVAAATAFAALGFSQRGGEAHDLPRPTELPPSPPIVPDGEPPSSGASSPLAIVTQDEIDGATAPVHHEASADGFVASYPLVDMGGFMWQGCERHTGSRDNLVRIGGSEGPFFPATHLHLDSLRDDSDVIISEPPRDEAQLRDFLTMLVEQGTQLHVSVASIYDRGGQCDREHFNFLEAGEAQPFEVGGVPHVAVCEGDEVVADGIGEELAGLYRLRRLRIVPDGDEEGSWTIYQYLPSCAAVVNPIRTPLAVLDLLEREEKARQFVVDTDHRMVISCQAGKDRSVKLAIIRKLVHDLDAHPTEIPWENIPQRLLLLARIAESQIVKGAGIDSVRGSLQGAEREGVIRDGEFVRGKVRLSDEEATAELIETLREWHEARCE